MGRWGDGLTTAKIDIVHSSALMSFPGMNSDGCMIRKGDMTSR